MAQQSVRAALFLTLLTCCHVELAVACPECQYEACVLGACACLPESGCIIPAPVDPGKFTEKLKHDPIGALTNPLGPYNPTGIPTQGDVVEFAIKNPDQVVQIIQNPGELPYTPVAAAMISSRNAAIANGASGIPGELIPFLRRWYPDSLLGGVRWTSNWGPLQQTLQAAQMTFNPNTQAITVLNVVVFRDGNVAHDAAIWAHELVHVQQYAAWGVPVFARTWVNNSTVGGPVEAPAYARQYEAQALLAAGNFAVGGPSFPSGWGLSPCGCWGPVSLGASKPAPQCATGIAVPRACPGMCAGYTMPYQDSCL